MKWLRIGEFYKVVGTPVELICSVLRTIQRCQLGTNDGTLYTTEMSFDGGEDVGERRLSDWRPGGQETETIQMGEARAALMKQVSRTNGAWA